MSEINGSEFSVNKANYAGLNRIAETPSEEQPQETKEQLTDFSDNKAEALGRSSLLFKGASDNLNNDLKALMANPQIAENSDELFEKAYSLAQANGDKNPYETASTIATEAM